MALNGINANVLTLYKVSILGDENLAPILRSLLSEENDQPSDELHSHCILSNIFSDGVKKEHLHIVVQIQMPGGRHYPLGHPELHAEIQALLQIKCTPNAISKRFSSQDINLNEVEWNNGRSVPRYIAELESRLSRPRGFLSSVDHSDSPFLTIATTCLQTAAMIKYGILDDSAPSNDQRDDSMHTENDGRRDSNMKVDESELLTLAYLGRYFCKKSSETATVTSSAQKGAALISQFIRPPCYRFEEENSRKIEFIEQLAWPHPLLLCEPTESTMRAYTPKIVLETNESDRWRMLLQAIVAARWGRYLMKNNESPFIFMAFYLTKSLIVERYLVSQPSDDVGRKVHINQKDYDLKNDMEAVAVLLMMYIYGEEITTILGKLDKEKTNKLQTVVTEIVEKIQTLSFGMASTRTSGGKTKNTINPALDPVSEQNKELFGADDVQSYIVKMGYRFCSPLFGHPHVGAVSHNLTHKLGTVKFIPSSKGKEVTILRFLAGIGKDDNHTVQPQGFGDVDGGTVVLMPLINFHLTDYPMLEAHLHFIVQQLVEGVAFMHTHGVVHMDLKPDILVDRDGGRLWIIDFGLALWVRSEDEMGNGFSGTPGYAAPEVGQDDFSPVLADRWSCGNLIQEVCKLCGPSKHRDVLLGVSQGLMNEDPRKRPDLSEVARRLAKSPDRPFLDHRDSNEI